MRILIAASAALLLAGAPAIAQVNNQSSTASSASRSGPDSDGRQGVRDRNGPAVPPGDGITTRGHDPEGQPFIPPGYNLGDRMAVYPPLARAPAGLIGGEYPVCSARVTDRCVQPYTRYTRSASRR